MGSLRLSQLHKKNFFGHIMPYGSWKVLSIGSWQCGSVGSKPKSHRRGQCCDGVCAAWVFSAGIATWGRCWRERKKAIWRLRYILYEEYRLGLKEQPYITARYPAIKMSSLHHCQHLSHMRIAVGEFLHVRRGCVVPRFRFFYLSPEPGMHLIFLLSFYIHIFFSLISLLLFFFSLLSN